MRLLDVLFDLVPRRESINWSHFQSEPTAEELRDLDEKLRAQNKFVFALGFRVGDCDSPSR
jgi:hypothetical protein